jgi:MscS family membrane protein
MSGAHNTRTPALIFYRSEIRQRCCLSWKRTRLLGSRACLLSLALLFCFPAWGQITAPASTPAAAQPEVHEVPEDPLGRSTPRGTVLGFLKAARNGDDELAARYIDTRLKGAGAADLAHELFIVLDRRLPPRLHQLSNAPEGSLSNLLHPDREIVGTIASNHGSVDIVLEHVDHGDGLLWLFSGRTLDAIPDLYAEINVVSVENVLPDLLVNTRFARIPLYEWLAVFVGMPLLYFLTVLLNRLLSPLVGAVRRSLCRRPDLRNPEFLPNPVRLLLLAIAIQSITSKVGLPLLARQIWSSIAAVITIAASVWLLILFSIWGEEYFLKLLVTRHRTGTASVLRLTRRVVNLLTIFVGLVVTLRLFRINATAALTGLGVGGIAVALAAQKTLENVIGGVSLIFDQAVRVGDNVRVGAAQGTVEEIGLRSTRIRTLDRTVVSVPNGQIANMTLENISSRDKFWFHPLLPLRYGTTSAQLRTVLDGIRDLLKENQQVELESVQVRLLGFGPSSLEVEAVAYVLARDRPQFLEIQEVLLLRIIECIESSGSQLSSPMQTVVIAPSASSDVPLKPPQTG